MEDSLSISEIEKLAYKVWYAKFEDTMKESLKQHMNKINEEFSLLRKYKSEIYSQYDALRLMAKEATHTHTNTQYAHKELWKEITKIKETFKNIQSIERKLSYALGEPYDKRLLKKEFKKDNDNEVSNEV
jgi:hypothetical protein